MLMNMSFSDEKTSSLQWLFGEAEVCEGRSLPFMACASRSILREADPVSNEGHHPAARGRGAGQAGLSLIINDDHGMTPTVTIVNQTDAPVTLRAVSPSLLATENGIYDIGALLAEAHPIIEPGNPLVLRIADIGRNASDPFRVSLSSR